MTFKQLRDKAGLSQAGLAAIADVHQTTIGQIEIGNVRDPRYSTIKALAKALGTSPDALAKVIARGSGEVAA